MPEPDHRRLLELEIRTPGGSVDGPMDLHAVRERIYTGTYRGRESLRVRGESWVPITSWPRLQELFTLVDVDVGALAIEQQHVKGWKKRSAEPAPKPVIVRPEPPPRRSPPPAPRKEGGLPWGLIGVVLLVLAVVAGLAWRLGS